MKLYLAGPMRGHPDFNFPAFDAAAAHLRSLGHEVFSPADRDRERWGDMPSNPQGSEEVFANGLGSSALDLRRECFADDMEYICKQADGIALLPGWKNSKGATAEHATALALGLCVFEQHDMGWRKRSTRTRKPRGIASGVIAHQSV